MLSPKKEKFIEFVKEFTLISGRAPTFIEIMEGLNFKSLGTVNWYIVELEKGGHIQRVKGFNGKRALSILEENINNKLPLLGIVSAGMPLEVYSHKEYIDVPHSMYQKNNFVLKVNGDSMKNDGILDGDYIIIEKNNIAREGDSIVAIVNGEATLKRYYIGSHGIELHPRNDRYGIIYVNEEDDFQIQGLLKGVFRKY